MWELLKEKTGIIDAVLIDRVNALSLQDGKLDGNTKPNKVICPDYTANKKNRQTSLPGF